MPGSSQSNDSNGRALPDLPQLDPNRIRFAHRNSLAGILYVLAIPASLLVVWFFTALLVNFLDSPGRYAPNGTVAGAGGVLSGAIKVCFFAGVVLISGFLEASQGVFSDRQRRTHLVRYKIASLVSSTPSARIPKPAFSIKLRGRK